MDNEEIKQLKEENARLTSYYSAKTEMLSIGMHQVRTSLSAMKWIFKMLLDRDLGSLTDEQENLLHKASETNERAINTTNEILHSNKTEEVTEKTYSFAEVDIIELIENAVFDFFGEAHNKNIEVIFLKPEHDFPKIYADKEKIQVVLQNLVENSIKYSDNNGKVFITPSEKDSMVQVSIKNNGLIISEEGKSKIFEKFYREPDAQKREVVGSGIGLYIVKKIVENHEGKIWFESSPKEGTTFYFTVPKK